MKTSLSLLAVIASVAVACSSTTTTSSSSSSGSGSSSSGGSASDGGTDSGSKADSGSKVDSGGGGACASEATNQACQQCCATNNQTAYQAFITALLACGCKPGNCQTECADTACATTPKNPSPACNTCLNNVQGAACKADLDAACTGAGACAPFSTCAQTDCAGKP